MKIKSNNNNNIYLIWHNTTHRFPVKVSMHITIDECICNKFVIIIVFNSYKLLLLFITIILRRWHTMRNRLDSNTRFCARPPSLHPPTTTQRTYRKINRGHRRERERERERERRVIRLIINTGSRACQFRIRRYDNIIIYNMCVC